MMPDPRRQLPWSQRPLVRVLAVVALIVTVALVLSSTTLLDGENDQRVGSHETGNEQYAIMIDAGSTGSRIHVYRFAVDGSMMVLQDEVFEQLKPGLSHYRKDVVAAASSLLPLLDKAKAAVPAALHKSTPINLKATAGLRLLGAPEAAHILEAARQLVYTYPFFYDPDDAVEIMDGLDEGLFGWVTINYLQGGPQGTLQHPPLQTSAVLDLGGGSTQIAMSTTHQSAKFVKTSVMGSDHTMFDRHLHSFLGFGLMAGRAKVLEHNVPAGDPRRTGLAPLLSACVPKDVRGHDYAYGDEHFVVHGAADAGFEACLRATMGALRSPSSEFTHDVMRPQEGQPIVALSYYFDRAVDAKLVPVGAQEGRVTPKTYMDAARDICALTHTEVANVYGVGTDLAVFLCLDLCFIGTLLIGGFLLDEEAPIVLAKSMMYNGARVETQWSLGAGLAEISETRRSLGLL